MQRTRALELMYMRENTTVAVTEHEHILEALRNDDLPGAVRALRQNMQSAVPALVAWLSRRPDAPRASKDQIRISE